MATTNERGAGEPGRMKQLVDVFKMTAKYDKPGIAMMIVALVLPIIAAVLASIFVYDNNVIMWILLMLLGLMIGFFLFMRILNWRAERVMYSQIEGQPGATGAVLQASLRGQWRSSDMPVAINPRTKDVVFRAIGKPGVVLFTESNSAAAKKLLTDEQRKLQRTLPNVPVHHILVGPAGVKLADLRGEVKKLPKKIRREEILAIDARLASLQRQNLPIPKGVDPNRIRPSRSNLR
ncbi:DUF4191 domain-containing protein [Gulosibacter bifidus]|uniref:DUF4191 domain-containing protein n=1 Tax=Gulosibacter bifidus TaxID=272239 RepID=A0ABW5RH43_9MICO|nr:DUF4191 domain-containing protein [Gulosibacter bifidus]